MIETIDSIKLANELNKRWSSISPSDPLKVLVQVNTSNEEGWISKSCTNRDIFNDLLRTIFFSF